MRIKFPVLAVLLSSLVATSLGACGSDSSNAPSCNNNNMVDNGEMCDGLDLHGQSCSTVLMMQASGTLSCKNCQFDTSMCTTGAGGASGTGGGTGTGGS
jgi:hypothetical protein